MYKDDLALNNLQWLICHKTRRNQTKCLAEDTHLNYIICIYNHADAISLT